ncbi:MAG: sulfate transporter, partial [Anaerovoracaceae bacterium]
TKKKMHQELLRIKDIFRCTILFVTHDFTEAQNLATRVGVMVDGRLHLMRKTREVFSFGEDKLVNDFLGLSCI